MFSGVEGPKRLSYTAATTELNFSPALILLLNHPMRAYYSTHKHIRLFVLGTPEGWHVGLYDLHKRKWTDLDGSMQTTLKEAKADAQRKAATMFGKEVSGREVALVVSLSRLRSFREDSVVEGTEGWMVDWRNAINLLEHRG